MARGAVPDYWAEARRRLSRTDPVLRRIIAHCGAATLRARGDPFGTLARSIVGQQISVKAADSVWRRLAEEVGEMTPESVLDHAGSLTGCGLSARKAEYLTGLARRFVQRELRPRSWRRMDDEAVIAELVRVRGIGRWTAEMFLIFNLLRPDVLPVDDLGLLRAAGLHYFEGEPPDRRALMELAESWQPWRTVATWYLWRSLDPVPVEY